MYLPPGKLPVEILDRLIRTGNPRRNLGSVSWRTHALQCDTAESIPCAIGCDVFRGLRMTVGQSTPKVILSK